MSAIFDQFGKAIDNVKKNAVDFVFGTNESQAKNQFRVNARLQRTKATGNRQGFTIGTKKARFPVVKDDLIRLPNRAVPLNANQGPSKKVPSQRASPQDASIVARQKRLGR